jgi:hypothetical protein
MKEKGGNNPKVITTVIRFGGSEPTTWATERMPCWMLLIKASGSIYSDQ